MKTYDVEVQRLKAMRHDHGMIEIAVDALVQPRPLRDEGTPTSVVRIPVEHARSLLLLLNRLGQAQPAQPSLGAVLTGAPAIST